MMMYSPLNICLERIPHYTSLVLCSTYTGGTLEKGVGKSTSNDGCRPNPSTAILARTSQNSENAGIYVYRQLLHEYVCSMYKYMYVCMHV